MKKTYKVKWNRVLTLVLIPIILVFLIYFGFIKDYDGERLKKLGYNKEEITYLKKELSTIEIKNLNSYSYLPYLTELIKNNDYQPEKMLTYIEYIEKLDLDYEIKDIIYIVNNGINYPYSEKLTDLINSKYFILSKLERYMDYNSDDVEKTIREINSNLDHKFYDDSTDADVSKDTLMLVNKYYYIKDDYYYGDLVTIDKSYDNKSGSKLNSIAYEAFKNLVDDAEKEGYHIRNNSAYRSYDTQKNLYNSYKQSNGVAWADKWSAHPGYSEHQTGLALDVGVKNEYALGKFETSKEFTWMIDNAYKYGFILRYPKDKENITGYGYEPWHYRYVGLEAAKYIYDNNITFEEYYAYFIEK